MMRISYVDSAITKIQVVVIAAIVITATAVPTYFLTLSYSESFDFSLNVITRPASFGEIVYVPGQTCIFLLTVDEDQDNAKTIPMNLIVTSSDCKVAIFPQSIVPGQIAELAVFPTKANVDKNVTVTLQGERQELKRIRTFTLSIVEWEDTLESEALSIRDRFIPWLSTNCHELGIANETAWDRTIVNPRILVVMHYLFLSEDWEMYLNWHVMVAPYDWARIYLRPRFNQTAPLYAFEISSIQGQAQPIEIEVPDWV